MLVVTFGPIWPWFRTAKCLPTPAAGSLVATGDHCGLNRHNKAPSPPKLKHEFLSKFQNVKLPIEDSGDNSGCGQWLDHHIQVKET